MKVSVCKELQPTRLRASTLIGFLKASNLFVHLDVEHLGGRDGLGKARYSIHIHEYAIAWSFLSNQGDTSLSQTLVSTAKNWTLMCNQQMTPHPGSLVTCLGAS